MYDGVGGGDFEPHRFSTAAYMGSAWTKYPVYQSNLVSYTRTHRFQALFLKPNRKRSRKKMNHPFARNTRGMGVIAMLRAHISGPAGVRVWHKSVRTRG